MRKLRGENMMVLRTDKRALYIYAESQWINVLVIAAGHRHKAQRERGRGVSFNPSLALTFHELRMLLYFLYLQFVMSSFCFHAACCLDQEDPRH